MTNNNCLKLIKIIKVDFFIVGQILAFASNTNSVTEGFVSKVQTNCISMFYVIENRKSLISSEKKYVQIACTVHAQLILTSSN